MLLIVAHVSTPTSARAHHSAIFGWRCCSFAIVYACSTLIALLIATS
jgi:hypothetical protein